MVSRPLLCVTVTAATMAELRRKRDAVVEADLIELRLDSVSDPSVAGALAGRRRPVIVTCRPAWEGGGFTGSEEDRRRNLKACRQRRNMPRIELALAPQNGRHDTLAAEVLRHVRLCEPMLLHQIA